jgi:iron(III) transport system permease protein
LKAVDNVQPRPIGRGWTIVSLSKRIWGDRPASWGLVQASAAVALLMAIPAIYILIRAAGADTAVWGKLFSTSIPALLGSTMSLTVGVTALAALIAVPAAWLVTMSDIPGKRLWQWLLALPLAIPPFIGALAYITIFGPRGLFQQQLSAFLGVSRYELNIPSIYSFTGTLIIMALFTYPYIFMLVAAALRSQNQSLIDAARAGGLGPARVLLRVTLPLIRPSIAAGSLLVALYVLSDFGAISLLRYRTFTSAIYQQLVGRYDLQAAAALSTVLMVLTITVIWLSWRSQSRARYFQTISSFRPAQIQPLGRWKWPALIFVLLILATALVIPIIMLTYWTGIALAQGSVDGNFWRHTINSVIASGLAATLAVAMALPVVYMAKRHGGLLADFLFRTSYSGYALPGVLVGLGMVFFFNNAVPWLYGSVFVLILAYVVRFLPQCLQAEEAGLSVISPNMEEAARSFGYNTIGVLRHVTIPLMLPAMAAGWALVFISAMKELPATLMLRPAGFDTLAVRVWINTSEGFFSLAAPPALLLVLASIGPLLIVNRRSQSFTTGSGKATSDDDS